MQLLHSQVAAGILIDWWQLVAFVIFEDVDAASVAPHPLPEQTCSKENS
jgi:hypothetical protein